LGCPEADPLTHSERYVNRILSYDGG